MNYLTNFYKNKAEQLQEQINLLENRLKYLNEGNWQAVTDTLSGKGKKLVEYGTDEWNSMSDKDRAEMVKYAMDTEQIGAVMGGIGLERTGGFFGVGATPTGKMQLTHRGAGNSSGILKGNQTLEDVKTELEGLLASLNAPKKSEQSSKPTNSTASTTTSSSYQEMGPPKPPEERRGPAVEASKSLSARPLMYNDSVRIPTEASAPTWMGTSSKDNTETSKPASVSQPAVQSSIFTFQPLDLSTLFPTQPRQETKDTVAKQSPPVASKPGEFLPPNFSSEILDFSDPSVFQAMLDRAPKTTSPREMEIKKAAEKQRQEDQKQKDDYNRRKEQEQKTKEAADDFNARAVEAGETYKYTKSGFAQSPYPKKQTASEKPWNWDEKKTNAMNWFEKPNQQSSQIAQTKQTTQPAQAAQSTQTAGEDFSSFWQGKQRYGDLDLQDMMRQNKRTNLFGPSISDENQPIEYRAAKAELIKRGVLKA